MIYCEQCGDWFHYSCMGFEEKIFEALESLDYVCIACCERLKRPYSNDLFSFKWDSYEKLSFNLFQNFIKKIDGYPIILYGEQDIEKIN
jgi:hypothetical protein